MNKRLQAIIHLLQQSESLTPDEKKSLADAVNEIDKEITITEFKLERTEKVKRTTAILLEQTIAELEEKRKSVEAQNRELEIEASLERVRSRTMAMQRSEELVDVASILFQQVKALGVPQWNCGFNIWELGDKEFTYYPGSPDGKISPSPCKIPLMEHPVFISFDDSRKRGDELFVYEKEGEYQAEHYKYMLSLPGVGDLLQSMLDAGFQLPTFQIDHVANFSYGNLIFITYEHFPEMHDVFKRFAKVFEQTYTRFLDLQKAEAQAREAQIEAALERVRSRTMSMQKSEELKEIIQVVYDQFRNLNILIEHAGFIIDYKARNDMNIWLADPHEVPTQVTIPYFDSPHWNSFNEAKEKGLDFFANHLSFEEKNRFYNGLFNVFPGVSDEAKEYYFGCPGLAISTVLLENVGLYIENFSGIPYSNDENDLLIRFGKVFQQTYTRFLDLQKAEAQAREAQIETALEKVRSRSLAMYHSDELEQVVASLFNRLVEIGLSFDGALIFIFDKEKRNICLWIATNHLSAPVKIDLPYDEDIKDNGIIKDLWNAIENGEHIFNRSYSGETKDDYFRYVSKYNKSKIPESVRKIQSEADLWTAYFAAEKNSIIGFDSWSGHNITNEDFQTLIRFARVFEQSYTRFLDLQKAEAQARDAQIESALEKVRSRSLAMQKTTELREIVALIFSQMQKLGVDLNLCNILLVDATTLKVDYWVSFSEHEILPESYHIPYIDHPAYHYQLNAWRNESPFAEFELSGENKASWDEYLMTQTSIKTISESIKDMMRKFEKLFISSVAIKNGLVQAVGVNRLSSESTSVLQRFAKVFEQSYIRFLDLQKAEAQARESKIEAALERVRSRSMAMHKSDELANLSLELVKQVQALGVATWFCAFNIYDQDGSGSLEWGSNGEGTFPRYRTPREGIFLRYYEAGERGETLLINTIVENECAAHYEYLCTLPGVGEQLLKMKDSGIPFPSSQIDHVAYFKYGYLLFITYEPTTESHDIFRRFAKVFEQTYTRFLDLQKAEAQAREAQIQLALERVRARTMAMHQSSELNETAELLFDQIKRLGVESFGVAFAICEKDSPVVRKWTSVGSFTIPYTVDSTEQRMYDAWKNQIPLYEEVMEGEELKKVNQRLIDVPAFRIAHQKLLDMGFDFPVWQKSYVATFAYGYLLLLTTRPFDEPEIFIRFAKVFEQSYTRFLDLQKAEEQARARQIEAALEKIRSRSLAMHHSQELKEVMAVFFEKLSELNVLLGTVAIQFVDQKSKHSFFWVGNSIQDPQMVDLPYDKQMFFEDTYLRDGWRAITEGLDIINKEYSHEQKDRFFDYVFANNDYTQIPESAREVLRQMQNHVVCLITEKNSALFADSWNGQIYTDEMISVLRRAAKVFEQAYIRFLDLQKAEAQAREAQIEAALERVRARTMAMQKSDELADVAGLMFQQVRELGISAWTTGFNVWSDDNNTYTDYVTSPLGGFIEPYTIDTTVFPSFKEISDAKKSGQEFYVQYLEGEVLKQTYLELSKFGDKDQYVKMREGGFEFPTRQFDHFVFLSNISLMFITYDPVPEAHDVFKRFGKVFEQTYTRFLDLQKAESQAREAKIEASLERVRSKTMAMHSSDDVGDTVVTMFDELVKLGVKTNRCGVLIHSDTVSAEVWTAKSNPDEKATLIVGHLDTSAHPMLSGARNSWMNNESSFTYQLAGDDIKNYYKVINDSKDYRFSVDVDALPSKEIHSDFHFREGSIFAFTAEPIADEALPIFSRFAGVFGQTYTRFLDLQKAEAQTREAKIEASLERVRGKAMAMHSSEDLAATIGIFYRELESFSITPRRCGVGLLDKETRMAEVSTMNTTEQGDSVEVIGKLKMEGHPVLEGIFDNWILQCEYHPVLRGNEIKEYYQLMRPQISFPEYPNDAVQFGYFFYFTEGGVYAWTEKELVDDELKIYRRFTTVLSLTYQRYKDLKDAEVRAKEAVKQATIDRVRAEIASMRTKQDLDRITPLIWNELMILGIPFVRCGVFIMDDKRQQVHTFLSTPDGKAIAAFQLDYSVSNLKEAISHWHDRLVYVTHWGQIEFGELADILMKQGSIASRDQYLNTLPTEGIYLHFLPFLQGMLYVGNITRLQQEDIHLLQSLAEAFSTAYARYEDFNKLEAAKQQVDQALIELKQTQQQLVQAEKMASLGELTAGIAHEIQNPLNFVNNFSEVSNEMIDEMVEEVKNGNFNEAKIIANDLKQNLEKINHHGKRADGIVKSMLQHSRSSSGQKELTDINVLADEYLRLAYHGLRARDKTFNAKFETDFDSTLEKIHVIPQDIGRVILNLINNAFYAVTEKRNANLNGYEPTVSVSTKQRDDKVQIIVKDNGNGISQKVLDKIFQPFFTTKPTGQGTGLGLSLSYDIVKAHGGELLVESINGSNTVFTIILHV